MPKSNMPQNDPRLIDLTDKRFGKLVATRKVMMDGYVAWELQCDCGNKIVKKKANLYVALHRNKGQFMSCGCVPKNLYKHGLSAHQTYSVWDSMKSRCYRKTSRSYKDYGGRGIIICDDWKNDYMNFYKWAIQNCYKEGLTIERVNNNGNYEPSNCKWVTIKEQGQNRRTTRLITIDGKTKNLTQWSEFSGHSIQTIRARIKMGWSEKDAVFEKNTRHK